MRYRDASAGNHIALINSGGRERETVSECVSTDRQTDRETDRQIDETGLVSVCQQTDKQMRMG